MSFIGIILIFFAVVDFTLIIAIIIVSILAKRTQRLHMLSSSTNLKVGHTLRSSIFRERWREIMDKANENTTESLKIAIIEADKLLDLALNEMGLKGEHIADKLALINSEEVPSVKKIFWAHRLRNDIVHALDIEISKDEARKAISIYGDFLKEIGII